MPKLKKRIRGLLSESLKYITIQSTKTDTAQYHVVFKQIAIAKEAVQQRYIASHLMIRFSENELNKHVKI